MSLENTELTIGGTTFKGVYIAIMLSFATTIGGGIWAASEFFSRVATIEDDLGSIVIPDLSDIEKDLATVRTQLEDNNVAHLQGKLAELGVTLKNIGDRQQEVLDDASASTDKVNQLEKDFLILEDKVEEGLEDVQDFEKDVKTFKREVDDLWKGLDAASSPLGG